MKELHNYTDIKSRNAAENIHIVFDENAWDKMEALLNEDDNNPSVVPILNTVTVTATKRNNKTCRLLLLLLLLFVAITIFLFIKNYTTFGSKRY